MIDPNAGDVEDTGAVTKTIDLGAALQPLDVTFSNDGSKAYVTNWMGRSVSVIDTEEVKVADVVLSPPANPSQADHPSAITENPKRDEDLLGLPPMAIALNRSIGKSVRGRGSAMPRPRHERIIGSVPNDEAEEIEPGDG